MDVPPAEAASQLDLKCYFVRHRNALLVRGDFSGLFMDYYIHLMDIGVKHPPELDRMLKEALVGVTMHCASRPWNERHAWTNRACGTQVFVNDAMLIRERRDEFFRVPSA